MLLVSFYILSIKVALKCCPPSTKFQQDLAVKNAFQNEAKNSLGLLCVSAHLTFLILHNLLKQNLFQFEMS